MTWNIQRGVEFDRILKTLQTLDADVLLLQEVDRFCKRDALGMNWLHAGAFQEIGESSGAALIGQAVLSKYLSKIQREIRSCELAHSLWHTSRCTIIRSYVTRRVRASPRSRESPRPGDDRPRQCAGPGARMMRPILLMTFGVLLFAGAQDLEDKLQVILPKDQIPAIDQPEFDPARAADRVMAAEELVIGLVGEREQRAYSTWQLDRHEIVNDVFEGAPVAVTW